MLATLYCQATPSTALLFGRERDDGYNGSTPGGANLPFTGGPFLVQGSGVQDSLSKIHSPHAMPFPNLPKSSPAS